MSCQIFPCYKKAKNDRSRCGASAVESRTCEVGSSDRGVEWSRGSQSGESRPKATLRSRSEADRQCSASQVGEVQGEKRKVGKLTVLPTPCMETLNLKMFRADAFSRDVCSELSGKCDLDWTCGKPQKGLREAIDVVGKKNGKTRVLIEIELRRGAPFQNVLKVWRQICDGKLPKKLVFFQAFSRFYGEDSTRLAMAGFLAQKMQKEFPGITYIQLAIDYMPRKRIFGHRVIRGGGRRKIHAVKLAKEIAGNLRKCGHS